MKNYLPVLLLTCLLLTGCGALLERSYSVVEPYADRYWDSAAEDTLRAENHQDLVNSLLMLVEERAEEGTIRCYGAANSYLQAQSACREVSEETALGSYLLSSLTFDYANSAGYSALTCRMSYREDAEERLWRELQEDAAPPAAEPGPEGEAAVPEAAEPVMAPEIPPCPWEIRFYPDAEATEIVEVLLVPAAGGQKK